MLLRGHHYRTGERIDVTVVAGRILAVTAAGKQHADVEGDYLAPALVDLQINGGLGVNFTSDRLTKQEVAKVALACHRRGIAVFCPTVITAAAETICHALATMVAVRVAESWLANAIPGFHLEGPYISPEDGPRGAHPARHVRPADFDEFRRFQDAAGGLIRLVTLAPEVPGALSLIEKLRSLHIKVAIGHSAASPATIRDAVRAGATLSTHLGNGCARTLPRHDNLLWEQLACDGLTASIIPDAHHLPWSVVKSILRCKGPGRVIVTCDASPLAGMPPGRYQPWEEQVEVLPEGKIILPSQGVLAGSWEFTNRCVEKLLQHTDGLGLADIHDAACTVPAKFLELRIDQTPQLEHQDPARLVVYRRDAEGNLGITHSVIGEQDYQIPSTASPTGAAGC
jgi:N-acetylglucosamine-6-phosphate deacetylase